jgi:hypothetical protein
MSHNKTVIGQRKKPLAEALKNLQLKYYSIRFRILLKLTRWDKWEDKQFSFFPGFYWEKKTSDNSHRQYEWSLKRPFKLTYISTTRSPKNSDLIYVDYYSKFLWENNFEHNEDKSYSFDEAEFLDEAWRDEMNFMAGVDIL